MNTVINVHFAIKKLTATPRPIYHCQVVARHEYHDTILNAATPGILVVEPRNSCVTLFNAQVEFIDDKYSYLNSIDKVDYTKTDDIYFNRRIFTSKRINLLTDIAEVVLSKLIATANWDKHTWDSKARTRLVEPLFTITEEGLDEMISKDLTVTYG